MRFYGAVRINNLQLHTVTRMDITKIMLSERRQLQRGTENRQNRSTALDAKLMVVPLENSWLPSRPGAD